MINRALYFFIFYFNSVGALKNNDNLKYFVCE